MKKAALYLLALALLMASFDTQAQRRRRGPRASVKAQKETATTSPTPADEATAPSPEEKPAKLPPGVKPFEESITSEAEGTKKTIGKINWTVQYIEATGTGILDNDRFKIPAQARAMAIRGAVVVAQRNLLEIVKGVHVQGETTVEDMMTTRDIIITRVEGIVKGAEMVGNPIEKGDGSVEVRLRMPLYAENGLAPAVYDGPEKPVVVDDGNMNPRPDSLPGAATRRGDDAPAKEKGLALNLGGKPFDPTLFPVIKDEDGNVVLDFKQIYNPKEGKFPQYVKATKEALNQLGLKKGVEVLDVLDMDKGTIKISNASKSKFPWDKIINTAKTVGKFLLMLI